MEDSNSCETPMDKFLFMKRHKFVVVVFKLTFPDLRDCELVRNQILGIVSNDLRKSLFQVI